jgi:hypothetical protein
MVMAYDTERWGGFWLTHQILVGCSRRGCGGHGGGQGAATGPETATEALNSRGEGCPDPGAGQRGVRRRTWALAGARDLGA